MLSLENGTYHMLIQFNAGLGARTKQLKTLSIQRRIDNLDKQYYAWLINVMEYLDGLSYTVAKRKKWYCHFSLSVILFRLIYDAYSLMNKHWFIPWSFRRFSTSIFFCSTFPFFDIFPFGVSTAHLLADFTKNSFTFTMFILVRHHWCRSMIHTLKWFISLWLRYMPRLRWHFQIFSFRSLSYSLVLYYLLYILYVLSLSFLYLFSISTS